MLKALDSFEDKKLVFIGSNADTHSEQIRMEVRVYIKEHANAVYFENLYTDGYHYLIKNAICLIGNSSSGIIEAPSFGAWTINIGDRQKGRVRGESIIDISCRASELESVIKRICETNKPLAFKNPYYRERAAINCYQKTLEILEAMGKKNSYGAKEFFDLR